MVFQPWQKHHYIAQAFMRKIHKKGILSSILDRLQNDEVFHAGHVRTIDITHNASPEQLERYAALYHFRYDPKHMEKGAKKRRPDYHQTPRPIVSMNKEAGQTQESKRRHNYREDLDPEKLDWLVWISHNCKWYFAVKQISALDSTQWHHQKTKEEHASGNREAFTHDDWWKANWLTTSWWETSRWLWNDEV